VVAKKKLIISWTLVINLNESEVEKAFDALTWLFPVRFGVCRFDAIHFEHLSMETHLVQR
jgi:hypothetical protein